MCGLDNELTCLGYNGVFNKFWNDVILLFDKTLTCEKMYMCF